MTIIIDDERKEVKEDFYKSHTQYLIKEFERKAISQNQKIWIDQLLYVRLFKANGMFSVSYKKLYMFETLHINMQYSEALKLYDKMVDYMKSYFNDEGYHFESNNKITIDTSKHYVQVDEKYKQIDIFELGV